MKQITVGDNTYKSISAAWRAEAVEGLPMVTVRWRLNHGWIPTDAFKTPIIPPPLRRGNQQCEARQLVRLAAVMKKQQRR